MKRTKTLLLLALLVPLGTVTALRAQEADDARAEDVAPGELREAMREYFGNRLRSELSLDDAQVKRILPRIQDLERTRQEAQRAKSDAVRRLRRGMERGASDAELQQALDDLERAERDHRRQELDTLKEIDGVLSVRQRVQLRFFIQSFRRDMQARIHELRGKGPAGRDRQFPNRRRSGSRRP